MTTLFLEDHDPRTWRADAIGGCQPLEFFVGGGDQALEVAVAEANRRPSATDVRALWKARHGDRANPLVLVVRYPTTISDRVMVCGPIGDNPPVLADLEPAQVERLCHAALVEPDRHAAARFLSGHLPEIESELPGVRNAGLLALHELAHGVRTRADWDGACASAKPHLDKRGRQLIEALDFTIEVGTATASILTVDDHRRAVAVFLEETETFEEGNQRFDGNSPVTAALATADRQNLPWVVVTRGGQIRLYSRNPDVGVGRKGRDRTYTELNLSLLADEDAGFLHLLFSAAALRPDGTLEQILDSSADFASDLGERLRDRVYFDAVPPLATAIARRAEDMDDVIPFSLGVAYDMTMLVLFRLLFVAYAEDRDLLPYRTNSSYRDHSLKTIARGLAEREPATPYDPEATSYWTEVRLIWQAVNSGNADWGVPAYNGGLFAENDPDEHTAGHLLGRITLTNAEFGPTLRALLVDTGPDGTVGPVDFRSLSVREFGTIYEGLLESELGRAPSDLAVKTVKGKETYLPAGDGDHVSVGEGEIYFHNRSGVRKSTGSYFTKPFAVEHLLDHALEPAISDHLERIDTLLDEGNEIGAAEAFLDFRCVDLAMGSAHFLVAAVDRIEARFSAFLAERAVPEVHRELETLRSAAVRALGELAPGVEIETGMLLRRQVARRCIYGVDLNRTAVELARLGLWIHTFVPGLPLSFLDRTLVQGNSLTGIGTIDEAVELLDGTDALGTTSLFRDQIMEFLDRASEHLRRLGTIAEFSTDDIQRSKEAHRAALTAVEPAAQLFDLLVAGRFGTAQIPVSIDTEKLDTLHENSGAAALASDLFALHLPIAFPEVFVTTNPGFNCVLGNPPFSAKKTNEVNWWGLRFAGIRSLTGSTRDEAIALLRHERPDLVAEYEAAVDRAATERRALTAGQYPGITTGDVNLFKAFCWRDWHVLRRGGHLGIVLPYAALNGEGNDDWRKAVLQSGSFPDVVLLANSKGWVFDDVHQQDTFGLTTARKSLGTVSFCGPFYSYESYREARGYQLVSTTAEFAGWSGSASFPLLPSPKSAVIVKQMAESPMFESSKSFKFVPYRELTSKERGPIFNSTGTPGTQQIPVLKGESFDRWNPDAGPIYGVADLDTINEWMLRKSKSRNSTLHLIGAKNIRDLPLRRCKIAYRKITRATDTLTLRFCLLPPEVANADPGQTLLRVAGDEADEAFVLAMANSMPLDWFARRWTDKHIGNDLLNRLPLPRLERSNKIWLRLVLLATKLSTVDERFVSWATSAAQVSLAEAQNVDRSSAIAEIDALSALAFGLDAEALNEQFRTFHHLKWDYETRLALALRFHEYWTSELTTVQGEGR